MKILHFVVTLTLCIAQCLAVLNTAQWSSSYSGSKDKAAAAGYQYNEHAQQQQSTANKNLGYNYQLPSATQQQQQSATSAGYQYQAAAQQYPTVTTTQPTETQSGYHYQTPVPQQHPQQQQPASIGSSFYQHSSVGPALALDVDSTLQSKAPAQAGHYFVPTQTAGYNYFTARPNQFDSNSPTTATASSLDNLNTAQWKPYAPTERQNYLLQKLAQLNLLSDTKADSFSAVQGQTNNLEQPQKQLAAAQFAHASSSQQDSQAFDSFGQPNQGYGYARPNNKQQGAYFAGATAPTALSNFELSKQQAAFVELSRELSAQTAQLSNKEINQQATFEHPLAHSAHYNNQQAQLGSQANGYNYAPQTAQANNVFNAATQANFQTEFQPFLAGNQNAFSQGQTVQTSSSYNHGSTSNPQQALFMTSSELLRGEEFSREQQQQQAQRQQELQQQQQQQSQHQSPLQQHQQQSQHQSPFQQHQPQYQPHSQTASPGLSSLDLPSNAYVYQKTQSQSYELPTIIQQGAAQTQSFPNHQAVRRPHVLYGIPTAERVA